MFEALTDPAHRRVTLILLGVGLAGFVLASILGISDNPPGLILLLLGAIAVVLGIVHPWRTARNYRSLFVVGILSFPVLVVLHNVTEVLAGRIENGIVSGALQIIAVGTFILAIFGSPPAIATGLAGWIIFGLRSVRARSASRPTRS